MLFTLNRLIKSHTQTLILKKTEKNEQKHIFFVFNFVHQNSFGLKKSKIYFVQRISISHLRLIKNDNSLKYNKKPCFKKEHLKRIKNNDRVFLFISNKIARKRVFFILKNCIRRFLCRLKVVFKEDGKWMKRKM